MKPVSLISPLSGMQGSSVSDADPQAVLQTLKVSAQVPIISAPRVPASSTSCPSHFPEARSL